VGKQQAGIQEEACLMPGFGLHGTEGSPGQSA